MLISRLIPCDILARNEQLSALGLAFVFDFLFGFCHDGLLSHKGVVGVVGVMLGAGAAPTSVLFE